MIRFTLIFIAIFFCGFFINAKHEDLFLPDDSLNSMKQLEVGILVAPFKYSFYEYYSIGYEQGISRKLRIGLLLADRSAENKLTTEVVKGLELGIGIIYNPWQNRKFYFDPFLYIAYDRTFISQVEIKYRGIGLMSGFRFGYSFKKVSLGLKCYHHISYGKVIRPYHPPPLNERYQFHWMPLRYCINLTYKI